MDKLKMMGDLPGESAIPMFKKGDKLKITKKGASLYAMPPAPGGGSGKWNYRKGHDEWDMNEPLKKVVGLPVGAVLTCVGSIVTGSRRFRQLRQRKAGFLHPFSRGGMGDAEHNPKPEYFDRIA